MMLEFLSKIWFSVLCALCLVAGALLWAVQTWAAPYMPLVICGLGVALILGITLKSHHDAKAAASAGKAGVEVESKRDLGLQIAPLVIAVIVCALWLFAPVRQAAAGVASEFNLLTEQSMRTDPDRGVRTAACRVLLRTAAPSERDSLLDTFYASQNLRDDCLQAEIDANNPLASWIAKRVAQRWRHDLANATGERTEEQACQTARQLSNLGRADDRVQLLQYALRASSPKARQCFVEALGDISDISTIVGAPESVPDALAAELIEPLTQRVFFDKSARDLRWSSANNKRWVWSLSCSMVSSANVVMHRDAGRSLDSMAYRLSCAWNSDTTVATLESVRWPQICPDLAQPLRESAGAESLCPVIMPHLVEVAVERAQNMVRIAASSFSMHSAAADVATTPVGAGRGLTKSGAATNKLLNMTASDLFGDEYAQRRVGCQDMTTQILGAIKRSEATEAVQKMGRTGVDCGPRPGEKTLGENYAKLKKVRSAKNPKFDTFLDRRYLNKTYGKDNVDAEVEGMKEKVDERTNNK